MVLRSKRSVRVLFLSLILGIFGFNAQAGSVFSRYSHFKGLSVVGAVAGLGYLSYTLWQQYKAYNSFDWKMAQKIENKPDIVKINGNNSFYTNAVEAITAFNGYNISALYQNHTVKTIDLRTKQIGWVDSEYREKAAGDIQSFEQYVTYHSRMVIGSISLCKKYKAIGFNKKVLILDAKDDSILVTLEGHTGYVSALTWSCDSKTLVSGDFDGTIIVWKR